ncbi:hypothetical protein [Biomaibacter acetigenes]|uniref:hypothetical protein n=1 Tax=Biomaibacter acetigenes TaxID=2316383 RepID=UPI0013CEA423|nr:hypothetical protein [Biomaibacter acetigenes]
MMVRKNLYEQRDELIKSYLEADHDTRMRIAARIYVLDEEAGECETSARYSNKGKK